MLGMSIFSKAETRAQYNCRIGFLVNVEYLMLVVNYVIQIVIIWNIHLLHNKDVKRECTGSTLLRSMCMFIFVASILHDLDESFNLWRWQHSIKTTKRTEPLTFEGNKIISGFSVPHKILNVVLIIIPKM